MLSMVGQLKIFEAVFSAVVLQNFLSLVSAHHDDDGFLQCGDLICYHGWSRIVFCCGESGNQCCYTPVWYATWYFWFGAGMVTLLLISCCSLWYKKQQNRRRTRVAATRTRNHNLETWTTHHTTNTSTLQVHSHPAVSDLPPAYQQYQQQSYPVPIHPYKSQYIPSVSASTDAPPPYTQGKD